MLKKIDTGEADEILVLYTKNFGKIRAFAKGIKKEEAKLKGHLEPLALAEISFVLGKKGERLTHAQMLRYGYGFRSNYEKLQAAYFIANLLDSHCLEGEKDQKLWEFLLSAFLSLESTEKDAMQKFTADFERGLFDVLGFSPLENSGNSSTATGFLK